MTVFAREYESGRRCRGTCGAVRLAAARRRPRSGFRCSWATLAAILLAACSRAGPPNILVLVIDSLRADRLGWYADDRRLLTPFLCSLAERGTVFWNAYAPSSWTLPSIASLWTSTYPSQHKAVQFETGLSEGATTFAAALHEMGYVTGAFTANVLISPGSGFGAGFDAFRVLAPDPRGGLAAKTRAREIHAAALAWLDATAAGRGHRERPVFLYLHYMDVHFPYLPPQRPLDLLLSRAPDADAQRNAMWELIASNARRWEHLDAVAEKAVRTLYDAEVLALDSLLADFFAALRQRGFLDRAVVVVTADHGEELNDHGRVGHGKTLYQEVIRVPLLVAAVGQRKRADIRDAVSLVDLGPTILELAGARVPDSFEGRSLRAYLPGAGLRCRLRAWWERALRRGATGAYSELMGAPRAGDRQPPDHRRAYVVPGRKLLARWDGPLEAYDLEADPSEKQPGKLDSRRRAALERALEQLVHRVALRPGRAAAVELDERTREQMRALGYGIGSP